MFPIDVTSKRELTENMGSEFLEVCIRRAAIGDKTALCDLYEQTKSDVYGFALSILKNAYDAEDVLQDTYIRIYTSAGSYKPYGKPMAWILTIARNLSLMKLRDAKRTVNMQDEDWERYFWEKPGFTSEDRMVLSAAIKTLSSEECQIVMLHAVSGFKHREIAQLLEIPLSTTLSKYSRAIKKLEKQFTEGE